eukprot:6480073-Amphidinium_carterae.1
MVALEVPCESHAHLDDRKCETAHARAPMQVGFGVKRLWRSVCVCVSNLKMLPVLLLHPACSVKTPQYLSIGRVFPEEILSACLEASKPNTKPGKPVPRVARPADEVGP